MRIIVTTGDIDGHRMGEAVDYPDATAALLVSLGLAERADAAKAPEPKGKGKGKGKGKAANAAEPAPGPDGDEPPELKAEVAR